MTPQALPLEHLASCSEDAFVAHLGSVFEHAPWVARAVVKWRPFASADALHAAMMGGLRSLGEAQLVELLRGHPELAGAQARAGAMTADSIAEQGSLALGALDSRGSHGSHGEDTAARWDRLNARYGERFGFPFILCIRRHTRASALRAFERRLANDRPTELRHALDEIARISRLRLAARIADHGLADIAGRLVVQVTDAASGEPARGLRIVLHEAAVSGRAPIVETTIVSPDTVLLDAQPLRIGRYELRLHAADYFAARGIAPVADEPFLGTVPIEFGIDEPEGRVTLRITLAPSSYAVYRGA